ncbi:hypothetical protein Efla_001104 [Eimeria flavescens]
MGAQRHDSVKTVVVEFKSTSLSCSHFTGRFFIAGCIYPSHAPACIQQAGATGPFCSSPEIATMTTPPTRRELHRLLEEGYPRSSHRLDLEFSYLLTRPPSKPPTAAQETLPNRLIRTQRPREDNLDSGLLEPSARRQRTQILPASASDLLPTTPNAPEREESEAEERHCEGIRRGDARGARSPRSPPRRLATSAGEQGPLGATQVLRLQGPTSSGVSADGGPPSSAESPFQESAGEEPHAAPPAPDGGAGNDSQHFP